VEPWGVRQSNFFLPLENPEMEGVDFLQNGHIIYFLSHRSDQNAVGSQTVTVE
jgi:hypothetical protein